jgi:hypothetical protein
MGYPKGLPLKFTLHGFVHGVPTAAGMFATDLAVFSGNSGGPVISHETGLIEGIAVTGVPDFFKRSGENCWRTLNLPVEDKDFRAIAPKATAISTVLADPRVRQALGERGAPPPSPQRRVPERPAPRIPTLTGT